MGFFRVFGQPGKGNRKGVILGNIQLVGRRPNPTSAPPRLPIITHAENSDQQENRIESYGMRQSRNTRSFFSPIFKRKSSYTCESVKKSEAGFSKGHRQAIAKPFSLPVCPDGTRHD
jgi:hypothetical protein